MNLINNFNINSNCCEGSITNTIRASYGSLTKAFFQVTAEALIVRSSQTTNHTYYYGQVLRLPALIYEIVVTDALVFGGVPTSLSTESNCAVFRKPASLLRCVTV